MDLIIFLVVAVAFFVLGDYVKERLLSPDRKEKNGDSAALSASWGSITLKVIFAGFVALVVLVPISFLISRYIFNLWTLEYYLALWIPLSSAQAIIFGAVSGYGLLLLRILYNLNKDSGASTRKFIHGMRFTASILIILVAAVMLSSLPDSSLKIFDRITSIPTPVGDLKLSAPIRDAPAIALSSTVLTNIDENNTAEILQKFVGFSPNFRADNSQRANFAKELNFYTSQPVPEVLIEFYDQNIKPLAGCLQQIASQGGGSRSTANIALRTIRPLEELVRASVNSPEDQMRAFVDLMSALRDGMREASLGARAFGILTTPDSNEFCDRLWNATKNFNQNYLMCTGPEETTNKETINNMCPTEKEFNDQRIRPYSTMLLSILLELGGGVVPAIAELDRWIRNTNIGIAIDEKEVERPKRLQKTRVTIARMELLRIFLSAKGKIAIPAVLAIEVTRQQLRDLADLLPKSDLLKLYKNRICKDDFGKSNIDDEATNIFRSHIISTINLFSLAADVSKEFGTYKSEIIERAELMYEYLTKCPDHEVEQILEIRTFASLGQAYLTLHLRSLGSETVGDKNILALQKAVNLFRVCRDRSRILHLKNRVQMLQTNIPISERIRSAGGTQFERCAEQYQQAVLLAK